jgi:hypothetical protein
MSVKVEVVELEALVNTDPEELRALQLQPEDVVLIIRETHQFTAPQTTRVTIPLADRKTLYLEVRAELKLRL